MALCDMRCVSLGCGFRCLNCGLLAVGCGVLGKHAMGLARSGVELASRGGERRWQHCALQLAAKSALMVTCDVRRLPTYRVAPHLGDFEQGVCARTCPSI